MTYSNFVDWNDIIHPDIPVSLQNIIDQGFANDDPKIETERVNFARTLLAKNGLTHFAITNGFTDKGKAYDKIMTTVVWDGVWSGFIYKNELTLAFEKDTDAVRFKMLIG